jgi:isochorismate synthase
MDDLKDLTANLKSNQAFVLFRKPNESFVHKLLLAQPTENLKFPSFVVRGFAHKSAKYYPIIERESVQSDQFLLNSGEKQSFVYSNFDPQSETKREDYVRCAERAVDTIKSGKLKKVVLARTCFLSIDPPDLMKLFEELMIDKSAFAYVFHDGEMGTWAGASPEFLIYKFQNSIRSMALAGTRLAGSELTWMEKERMEQAVVGEYLRLVFKDHNVSEISQSNPSTLTTGSLEHIYSEVRGKIDDSVDLEKLIDHLHPTPALGGFPKELANDFIQHNEEFDRQLYGGFLGEMAGSDVNLFVNIRCMRLGYNGVQLFSGAGINAASNPEMEWVETNSKMNIMKSVLKLVKN